MRAATDIVVGFDGSPSSDSAVEWAAHQADQRGVRLRVVTAMVHVTLPFGTEVSGTVPHRDSSRSVNQLVSDGRLRAEKVLDAERVVTATVRGLPARALVDESREASLVVVGHPDHGKAREYVTGSVAFSVAAHARSDVAVVPPGDLLMPGPDHPVVVGTDGSPGGERAARRAAEVAARCDAPLVVVRAWQLPSLSGWPGPPGAADVLIDEYGHFESASRDPVESSALALRTAFPHLEVQTRLVAAHPVEALLEVAKDAGLLVVGTRGRGGFKRLLLGSVSRAVIHYTATPVVVVRPETA